MARWKVAVSGGELTDKARAALEDAGIEPEAERGKEFTALVDAADSAEARHRVEDTLRGADGYSAGAAESTD